MQIDAGRLNEDQLHDLLKGCVVPRPVAWISTIGRNGLHNVAPFSCFTFISTKPPYLAFSVASKPGMTKGTLANIERINDFVVNIPSEDLADAVNLSSAAFPPNKSKVQETGMTSVPAVKIQSHRIAEAPIQMECRLVEILRIGKSEHSLVVGEVLLFHIHDSIYQRSRIEMQKLKPLGRLAGNQYSGIGNIIELERPWLSQPARKMK